MSEQPIIDGAARHIAALNLRLSELTAALIEVEGFQRKALKVMEENEFVFTELGKEKGNWMHLSFSLYTDLCQVQSIAANALKELK